jgi:hypothetical protein
MGAARVRRRSLPRLMVAIATCSIAPQIPQSLATQKPPKTPADAQLLVFPEVVPPSGGIITVTLMPTKNSPLKLGSFSVERWSKASRRWEPTQPVLLTRVFGSGPDSAAPLRNLKTRQDYTQESVLFGVRSGPFQSGDVLRIRKDSVISNLFRVSDGSVELRYEFPSDFGKSCADVKQIPNGASIEKWENSEWRRKQGRNTCNRLDRGLYRIISGAGRVLFYATAT